MIEALANGTKGFRQEQILAFGDALGVSSLAISPKTGANSNAGINRVALRCVVRVYWFKATHAVGLEITADLMIGGVHIYRAGTEL
jgi:hypothetical protein